MYNYASNTPLQKNCDFYIFNCGNAHLRLAATNPAFLFGQGKKTIKNYITVAISIIHSLINITKREEEKFISYSLIYRKQILHFWMMKMTTEG